MTNETISQPTLPGHIRLCSYAFFTQQPAALAFADCSLPLRNDEPDSEYVTGACGLNAAYQSNCMAKQQAEVDGTVLMKLNMKFPLRSNVPKTRTIDLEAMRAVGFLHPLRMGAKLHEQLRLRVLELLKSTVSAAAHAKLGDLTLQGILIEHPVGARLLMADEPLLDLIVYRGIPDYKSERRRMIYVATVRAARASTMVAEAHLSKHIPVSAGSFH